MDGQLRSVFESLAKFTDADWEKLEAAFVPKKLAAKESVLNRGEVCRSVAFIKSGLLRYYYLVGGEEITGNFFFENAFAADIESFSLQKPAIQTIDAVENCELLCLGYEDLQRLYGEIPVLERCFRLFFERLIVFAQQRTASFLFDTPEQRYLNLIKQRPKVLQRVPQYMIASYLGITPESLSRVRHRLAHR
ncbi:MAG: Crp/Fnr family transcriptional regulator [Rhizobacter sp.]|nr:Crp/Fnr family transcriptional regulator [Chlorobiales bacterium]